MKPSRRLDEMIDTSRGRAVLDLSSQYYNNKAINSHGEVINYVRSQQQRPYHTFNYTTMKH